MKALFLSIAAKIGRRVRGLAGVAVVSKPKKAKPQRHIAAARSPAAAPTVSAPPCYIAVMSDCGHCGDACRASQKDWQTWVEKTFKGFRSAAPTDDAGLAADRAILDEHRKLFRGTLSTTRVPLAILDLTGGHEPYRQLIGPKGRNMVRKAEKLGYSFAKFVWNDHIDDIFAVNTSMSHRGGKEMTAGYRQRPPTIGVTGYCDLQRREYYGAFKDGTLHAYLVLVIFGHFATINTILGHGDHLKDGIMNGLIDFLVRDLVGEGKVRYVNYLTLRGGREGLDSFKKRVGFEEREVIFLAGMSRLG